MLGCEVVPRSNAISGCNTSREVVEALREVRCRLHVFSTNVTPTNEIVFSFADHYYSKIGSRQEFPNTATPYIFQSSCRWVEDAILLHYFLYATST